MPLEAFHVDGSHSKMLVKFDAFEIDFFGAENKMCAQIQMFHEFLGSQHWILKLYGAATIWNLMPCISTASFVIFQ